MYFDAHSDIWSDVTIRRLRGERRILRSHHLNRLRRGGVEGSIFVIWVDNPEEMDYAARTKQIMSCVRAEIDELEEEDNTAVVFTRKEMDAAGAAGKFYIVIGIEGMAALGGDPGKLDAYYAFGARHGMLTWNEENALGAGAVSGIATGLTEAGKQTVRKMQDMGMLVDVSHLNEAGFWDIIKLANRPIIASHSNCRALCDVPRNLTDEQLRAIRDAGGVVGLNAYGPFISAKASEQTVERLARHAAHMIDVMGIEHVGCGLDFFEFLDSAGGSIAGMGKSGAAGLKDAGEIPNLFACLEKMGLRSDELERIARLNFLDAYEKAVG